MLYLLIPGRMNFLKLGRYGRFFCEQHFRQDFSKDVDWLEFNHQLSNKLLTGARKAIVVEPDLIAKSRKDTLWIGSFWSDCSDRTED